MAGVPTPARSVPGGLQTRLLSLQNIVYCLTAESRRMHVNAIDGNSEKNSYALRVSRAKTRLTVYRPLYILSWESLTTIYDPEELFDVSIEIRI